MKLSELISDSYNLVGVVTMTTNKYAQAIRFLSNMIKSESVDFSRIYATTKEEFALVSGTAEYTIGSGGDFDTARPDRIVSMFVRDSGSDYTLVEIDEVAYNNIFVKDDNGRPEFYWFNREYPLAKIVFDVEADDTYALHIHSTKSLADITIANLTSEVSIPDEYLEALVYNLAIRLAPLAGMSVNPAVAAIASVSWKKVENINSQPVPPIAPESGLATEGIPNGDWRQ